MSTQDMPAVGGSGGSDGPTDSDAIRFDEPKTAMLLTEAEWDALAVICIRYMEEHSGAPRRHLDIARRVVEACSD